MSVLNNKKSTKLLLMLLCLISAAGAVVLGRELLSKDFSSLQTTKNAYYEFSKLQGKMRYVVFQPNDVTMTITTDDSLRNELAKKDTDGLLDSIFKPESSSTTEISIFLLSNWDDALKVTNIWPGSLPVAEAAAQQDAKDVAITHGKWFVSPEDENSHEYEIFIFINKGASSHSCDVSDYADYIIGVFEPDFTEQTITPLHKCAFGV